MGGKIIDKLNKSPINYFSDLFCIGMVVLWILAVVIITIAATYSMIVFADTSVWSYLADLVSVPLATGAGMWMIKNTVQHAMYNHEGKECPKDFFAKVDATEDEVQAEEKVTVSETTAVEEEVTESEQEGDFG